MKFFVFLMRMAIEVHMSLSPLSILSSTPLVYDFQGPGSPSQCLAASVTFFFGNAD